MNALINIFYLFDKLKVFVSIFTLDLLGNLRFDNVKDVADDCAAWQIAICVTLQLLHLALDGCVLYLPFNEWILTLKSLNILHPLQKYCAMNILRILRSILVAVIKWLQAVLFLGDLTDGLLRHFSTCVRSLGNVERNLLSLLPDWDKIKNLFFYLIT